MTKVYLAWASSGSETLQRHVNDDPVHILVAFPFLKAWERVRSSFNVASWCLDSGAFSVANSGATIDVDDYIAAARDVDACEVFGLDVIGDEEATKRNLERMWSKGVQAIPTFHYGSSIDSLKWCAQNANKVAIGGVARLPDRTRSRWLASTVGVIWPKRVHGFGCASMAALAAAPFDSVDASSWALAPSAMGAWAGYTGRQVSLKSRGVRDFWIEVEEHQRRERWAKARWRRELATL